MPEDVEIRPGEPKIVNAEEQENRKGYPLSVKRSVCKSRFLFKIIWVLLIVLVFLYIYLHEHEFKGRKGWMDLTRKSWRPQITQINNTYRSI